MGSNRWKYVSTFSLMGVLAGIWGAAPACGPNPGSGEPDSEPVCENPCEPDALRCEGNHLEVCAADQSGCYVWTLQQDCSESAQHCDASGDEPACLSTPTCYDGEQNQDETDVDCGGGCLPCATGKSCGEDKDCESGFCDAGTCGLCKPNRYSCLGNTVRQCSADGWSWITGENCGMEQKCDPTAGACGEIPLVGNPPGDNDENVTGEYYKYAHFTQEDGLINYCFVSDVDSFGDLIYVHAVVPPCPSEYGGLQGQIDVYRVELLDSDGDGKLEPDQHPSNPDNPGPVEQRTLTYVTTYDAPIGPVHHSEIQATEDTLYFPDMNEMFVAYDLATGQVTPIVDGTVLTGNGSRAIAQVGMDVEGEDHVLWYFSGEYPRRVYSYDPALDAWTPEFDYPDMAGDHLDGMEFVRDPNTGMGYVYVSDMTSDYIGQYTKDATGNWQQVNLFHYADPDVESVEGMGFGALNHFWVGGWSAGSLYELGGGDLGKYTHVN